MQNWECHCQVGYEGKKCERPTDECAANPCQNNAICVDLHNDYECDCSGTGYTGRHCDVDINECEFTVPVCRNNATCRNNGGGYHCDCIHNFCGKNCTATNVCNERVSSDTILTPHHFRFD